MDFGGDMSVINPNETQAFLTNEENVDFFGVGSIKPDVVKIPKPAN